ncbi:MAG: T9SS type A sorting domain-containing protein [Candidatus Marinimicrobia bacterium]|nr:T9SS type A sorting domain-containing protein [Candidatus Neomarinimicrobiota bacterium]
MKRFTLISLVLWVIAVFAIAETPADYYFPLQVGNRLVYRAGEIGTSWSPRTVYETIEGTDSIFGELFYKQVGSEYLDNNPTNEHVFHVFWLREDSSGTIMIGAVGLNDSRDLDSAMLYPYQYPFFHAGYLEQGYCQDTTYMGTRYHDSTLSVTETVETGIGTFQNCIQRRQFRIDSLGTVVWHEYQWYAKDVGIVKLERVTPDAHINLLTQVNFQTDVDEQVPNEFRLHQNYPNPFNPVTRIDYSIPLTDHVVMKVYDIHGKEIQTLINKNQLAGSYSLIFNAGDLASGIYIYTLQIGNGIINTNKMLLLK